MAKIVGGIDQAAKAHNPLNAEESEINQLSAYMDTMWDSIMKGSREPDMLIWAGEKYQKDKHGNYQRVEEFT